MAQAIRLQQTTAARAAMRSLLSIDAYMALHMTALTPNNER
jgi:hypothetical protein